MNEKRLDQLILELFPELTRSKIQSLIKKSKIHYYKSGEWKPVSKPGEKLEPSIWNRDSFKILEDDELYYVSRGALKIKGAVDLFKLDPRGLWILDVGLSTGGFSDFLLQSGAGKILGIDVGQDQLHEKLRHEPRLVFQDKVNIKNGLPSELMNNFFMNRELKKFDWIVVDVSFISLLHVIPQLRSYLSSDGSLLLLVKPQFELTAKDLNKKGVVKDLTLIPGVIEKINGVLQKNKLKIVGQCASPIEGENGNKEFLVWAQFDSYFPNGVSKP